MGLLGLVILWVLSLGLPLWSHIQAAVKQGIARLQTRTRKTATVASQRLDCCKATSWGVASHPVASSQGKNTNRNEYNRARGVGVGLGWDTQRFLGWE